MYVHLFHLNLFITAAISLVSVRRNASNIPLTTVTVHQHFHRVYDLIQTWFSPGMELDNESRILESYHYKLTPAPDELLNTIFCNCKSVFGSKCGYKKAGLQEEEEEEEGEDEEDEDEVEEEEKEKEEFSTLSTSGPETLYGHE